MKTYGSHHPDVDIPRVDILTLLFGKHPCVPQPVSVCLISPVESTWCAANEDTKIHVEAANPENSITKAEARDVLGRTAYTLRHKYGVRQMMRGILLLPQNQMLLLRGRASSLTQPVLEIY